MSLRVAVVGTGETAVRAYLPGLNDPASGIELIAVCDGDEKRADKAAHDFHARNVFYNFEAMLAFERPDLIFLLTAPDRLSPLRENGAIIAQSLMAGCHLYSEKPLVLTATEAGDLCDLADFQNRLLLCAPPLMLFPEYRLLCDTVNDGAVGKPLFARAQASHGGANRFLRVSNTDRYFDIEYSGALPSLYDTGIIALTVLTHCLGKVRTVSASANIGVATRVFEDEKFVPHVADMNIPDNIGLLLEFADGCIATLDVSYCLPYQRGSRYEIQGYHGALAFSEEQGVEVISETPAFAANDKRNPVQWHRLHTMRSSAAEEAQSWGQMVARHVQRMVGSGDPSPLGARNAHHILEIIEAAQISIRERRKVLIETAETDAGAASL